LPARNRGDLPPKQGRDALPHLAQVATCTGEGWDKGAMGAAPLSRIAHLTQPLQQYIHTFNP